MDTETLTVHPKGEVFEIIVQHDQTGSAYGITLSKNAYEQLRQHFVSGSLRYSEREIDFAYLTGVFNVSGIDGLPKEIDFREINKVLTRIKEVYQLEDIDVGSRRWRQVEARAIWAYYLIKVERIRHADAAKIVGRKRSMMYHYVKLVEDLYETNIPFRERFNRIGIPWRS